MDRSEGERRAAQRPEDQPEAKGSRPGRFLPGVRQDHHRAVVIGQKSFGKGSVQTVIPLGEYGAMRITTARYYTPSGRSIQLKGIVPDVIVKPSKVEEIESPFELSEGEYQNALKNDSEDKKDAKKLAADKKEKEELAKDYQLSRALDLVRALGLYQQGETSK